MDFHALDMWYDVSDCMKICGMCPVLLESGQTGITETDTNETTKSQHDD